MNWREKYKDKIVPAAEAVKSIKSGDKVMFQQSHGVSLTLLDALTDRADELENVTLMNHITFGSPRFLEPQYEKSFKHVSNFLAGATRKAYAEGRMEYMPCFYYQTPDYYRNVNRPDVFLVSLSMPDENGVCSYSLNPDYSIACVEVAKTVIAHINPNLPKTHGSTISLDEVTYVVEKEEEVMEVFMAGNGEVEKAIGQHIAPLINDGDTLQLGIGGVPDAVLSCLGDKKDLGIHSELFSDGVVDLYNAGVITNKKKNLHNGKFIANFLIGSQKLFDFVDDNPDVLMLPVDYVNDPRVIAKNDNMVSINSCIEVDLLGQVNADSVRGEFYSGVGGQVDFIRGASMSKGGKSIISVPSTAGKGKFSRIVCKFDEGTPITTSRFDVHYICTEFGIVELRGKTIKERAEALISIAHPDFREDLTQQAKEAGLI